MVSFNDNVAVHLWQNNSHNRWERLNITSIDPTNLQYYDIFHYLNGTMFAEMRSNEVRFYSETETLADYYCSDGTPINTCSTPKPLYCNSDANLVDKCSVCGCPEGYECGVDESCSVGGGGAVNITFPDFPADEDVKTQFCYIASLWTGSPIEGGCLVLALFILAIALSIEGWSIRYYEHKINMEVTNQNMIYALTSVIFIIMFNIMGLVDIFMAIVSIFCILGLFTVYKERFRFRRV